VSTDDRDPELDLQKLQFLLPFSFIEVPARYREAYRAYFVFLEADFEEFVAKEAGDEKVYANWMNERTLAMKVNRRVCTPRHSPKFSLMLLRSAGSCL